MHDMHTVREEPTAIGRRAFLRRGVIAAAGAGTAGLFPLVRSHAQDTANGTKLVWVRHGQATDEEGFGRPDTVRAMVHRAVRELSGKDSLADAWGTFVAPDDVVGLKVNVRAGRYMSTQPCVVDAIVEGLQSVGVKPNRIIVWDAWNREFPPAGYAINESAEGVRYHGSDHGLVKDRMRADKGEVRQAIQHLYMDKPETVFDKEVWFSKILAEEITALINVPLIKEHRISGIVVAMKNLYGSILNPWVLHGGRCDPYLAHLNALPVIRNKTRLVLVDGLRGLYNGGPHDDPPYRFRPNAIIAGVDPVAVDALGLRILEEKRAQQGLPPIGDRAKYLRAAAEIGLGTNDFSRIQLEEIDLAVEPGAQAGPPRSPRHTA